MQESIRNDFEKDHWGFLAEKYEILRGRDNLNSNKTPKEFCKDKERNWAYALNGGTMDNETEYEIFSYQIQVEKLKKKIKQLKERGTRQFKLEQNTIVFCKD